MYLIILITFNFQKFPYLTSKFLGRVVFQRINLIKRTMSSLRTDDVIFDAINNKGVITLNRPKALNAVNLSMISKIYSILPVWENEKQLVLIKGAGGKAFCSGGDVKFIVEHARKGNTKDGEEFFKTEYIVNGIIGAYKIPYVALIDGIVMGGGVGLSVHGQYRIATENTLFAMPETAIGLFPDVGASYFLPRLGGKLGLYLALTGQRLKGADVLKAGIATHYCKSECLKNLEKDILDCDDVSQLDQILKKFSLKETSEFSLKPYLEKINNCFSAPTIEEIFQKLEKDGSEWALNTLKTLKSMSPTSLKITLKELELGSHMCLNECLIMEYRLAVNCLKKHDFLEGVRALLIDKDKKPKWQPKDVNEVSQELVESHFLKLPNDLELKHKL